MNNLVSKFMGNLKLHSGAFIDLVDLNYQGVAKLMFIYPICNRHLVTCLHKIYGGDGASCVYINLFTQGEGVKGGGGEGIRKWKQNFDKIFKKCEIIPL